MKKQIGKWWLAWKSNQRLFVLETIAHAFRASQQLLFIITSVCKRPNVTKHFGAFLVAELGKFYTIRRLNKRLKVLQMEPVSFQLCLWVEKCLVSSLFTVVRGLFSQIAYNDHGFFLWYIGLSLLKFFHFSLYNNLTT